MPVIRDENIFIISPGSDRTLAIYGLGESLGPATIDIPTKVYQHPEHIGENYFASTGDESNAIYPIQNGAIVNVAAFNYLIKLVWKSVIADTGNPLVVVALVVSPLWTRPQIERITQYVFETMEIPAFYIIKNGLAASFAHALQDALIIDIGKDRTEITPVLEYTPVDYAARNVNVGGNTINKELARLLPDLSPAQIEALKKSPIYEVLNEDDTKSSWFAVNNEQSANPEDEGIIDVAAIVASGRTREILEQRELEKQRGEDKKNEKPNKDREFNNFVDDEGKTIEVGKQRFHGTEPLIQEITTAISEVMRSIDPINKRQDLWDNIIIVGRGSKVRGLKDAIMASLANRYLYTRTPTFSELPSTMNTGNNTPNGFGTPRYNGAAETFQQSSHSQVPTSLRLVKMAEYFPEWKGRGWEDAAFLGAELAARQLFIGNIENAFTTRTEYNEFGPAAIWEI